MSVDPFSEAGDSPESTGDNHHASNGSAHEAGANGASTNGAGSNGALVTIGNRLPGEPVHGWSYGPPARPEILKAKPNPAELLHAVRRRWPLAIGLGLAVATTTAALLWYFLPVTYEAFALLKVAERPPAVLDKSSNATDEFAIFKRTQVQLLKSSLVLSGTLRDVEVNRLTTIHEVSDDQVSWLKDQLVIDYPDDAEIMRVAMKGRKGSDLIKVVNKITKVYMKEIVERERDKRAEYDAKIERIYSGMAQEQQKQTDALHALEQLHKTSGSQAAKIKREMAAEALANLLGQRTKIFADMNDNKMQLMLTKAKRDNPEESRPPDVVVEAELIKDLVIARNENELAMLNEHAEMLRTKTPKSPKLKKLMDQIAKLEERIEERKNHLRPLIVESLANSGNTNAHLSQFHMSNLSMPMLEKQEKHLAEQLEAIEKKIEDTADEVASMESFSATVTAKQEELEALRRITTELKGQLDRSKVERQAPERVTMVDEAALANSGGDAVRKYVGIAFGSLFGFGLIVLCVAFVEFQSRKVNSVQEVNDGLGIRVVGELPNVSGRVWRRMRGGKGPSVLKALMAERIDGTRTAIIHTSVIDSPRVVMVTSAEPREGKTTTATQLAASLARSGRRTLLIDADIRNPGAHRVFEMPQDPGLCEMLRGEAEREAVIHPTRTANLWLLPAGRCDLRSVQALSTSYLGTAIAALCVQFDYVVIDSGPVLKIADPLLIGQHVDAAIVSVLRDVSKVPKVYEACERLRAVGITVLGSVVNGVKDDSARHGVELLMAETEQAAQAQTTTA
jgi:polysaccharide biosynthesis transport protein